MSPIDRTRLPPPGIDADFQFPAATKSRMSNGLGLWTLTRDRLPVVSVVLMLPAGAVLDPADRPGLASITGDMLDEGSGDRSAIQMQEALARLGAELDTDIGPDAVTVSLTLLGQHLQAGLRLLAGIVCRPRLAEADFERVRTLRLNRLRQLRDVPAAAAECALARALYGGHPYGHLPIGTTDALSQMRVDDVVVFHQEAYRPSRVTLVAAGAASHRNLAQRVEDAFGAWVDPPVSRSGASHANGSAAADWPASARLVLIDRPGAAQTELRIGHVAVSRATPDYHALILANAVLGGHFMSRINLNLRERKGYTYGARTGFDFRKQAGPFGLQTSVQTDATADAVSEALSEIAAIRDSRPATEDELELSRATLTKGYARNFETTGQLARGLTHLALYDLPDDTFADFSPRIRALGPGEVTDAANRHIHPERLVVVAVGDRAKIEDGLRALGLGDPLIATADL